MRTAFRSLRGSRAAHHVHFSASAPPTSVPPSPRRSLRAAPAPTANEIFAALASIGYRYSVLGTGLTALLLALATLQAPLIVVAGGGSLEAYQTISASVSDVRLFPAALAAAAAGR
jgi:hypothetical protein